ncbi:AAA+-type ATPase [Dispira simplex]|nr:AAA+-type ATPase [Dispira simplex]
MDLITTASPYDADYRRSRRVLLSVQDMHSMGLAIDDTVLLQARNPRSQTTDTPWRFLGVAWPHPTTSLGSVGLSTLARLNSQAAVGDLVNIQPWCGLSPIAKRIVVDFVMPCHLSLTDFLRLYIREILVDLVWVYDKLVFDVPFGSQSLRLRVEKFTVQSRLPDGEVPVGKAVSQTVVEFPQKEQLQGTPTFTKIDYTQIGGLEEELRSVREMVELPLTQPGFFYRYGQRPPRGVLLYGPPGTGKTLIARAVASETNAHVTCINGPSVMSKYYGDTEAKLRAIFQDAIRHQPAIIFIDEIDALCPKRDDAVGESEKRIVTTLLTLMDGCASLLPSEDSNAVTLTSARSLPSPSESPRLVVIGATNRPDALDDALRRPGRFDREIEIGIPNTQARLSILRTLLRSIPHTLTEDEIANFAATTHGYVGADLAALCHEAGFRAIQRHVEEEPSVSIAIQGATEKLGGSPSLMVTASDMRQAMAGIRPSAMREILLEIPQVRWGDIGGQDEVKAKLKESVEWPLRHPEAFLRMGIQPPKGVLLYGPPGCSKTLMAKALATEAGLNFIAIKGPELFNKWVGESEKAIRQVFRKARQASPSIVFFDEIDAIAVKRGGDGGGGSSVADRVLSQLLNELDGIEPLVNVTVVAATNRPDIIDDALLRPGRIDRMLYIGPPDDHARWEIFRIQFASMACDDDVSVSELITLTRGFSGAEIVALCQEAAFAAMEEDVHISAVAKRHFERCFRSFHRRITQEMLDFYDSFQKHQASKAV